MNVPRLAEAIEFVLQASARRRMRRALLVGISGIDGAGKGFVASLLQAELEAGDRRAAVINADGWLNVPKIRFDQKRSGENFFRHGLRLDEMFASLVLPLCAQGSIDVNYDHVAETASCSDRRTASFADVDIVLLEGIFIFQRRFVSHFDVKLWVDCSFETALARAIERSQEGLSPEQTIVAYQTTYFPAQQIHFAADSPREIADLVIDNDGQPICAQPDA
jgi:uridine kinase